MFSCVWTANLSLGEIVKGIHLHGSGLTVNDKFELALFEKQQVIELSAQYLQQSGLRFSSEELDCCYQHTKGYPVLVQVFLYILFEQKYGVNHDNFSLKQVEILYQSKANDLIDDLGARKNISKAMVKALKRLGLKEINFLGFKFTIGK